MGKQKKLVTLPALYDEFSCKCSECRSTCCQKWRIDLSKEEYIRMRHLQTQILSDPKQTVVEKLPSKKCSDYSYAKVKLTRQGMCPLLSDSHMCTLQQQCGFQNLPQICKQFPRLKQDLSSMEAVLGLDMGCERTLELLWEHADSGISFIQEERELPPLFAQKFVNFGALTDYAVDIRNLCIWILQNRSYTLSDRLILLGLALRDLQAIIDSRTYDQIPNWFVKFHQFTQGDSLRESLKTLESDRQKFAMNNLQFFKRMYVASSMLRGLSQKIFDSLDVPPSTLQNVHLSLDTYEQFQREFEQNFPHIDGFFENILVLHMFSFSFPGFPNVWKAYAHLCSTYSLFLFTGIANHCKDKDSLIDTLTELSRSTLNSSAYQHLTVDILQGNESFSLAHLAILVRG